MPSFFRRLLDDAHDIGLNLFTVILFLIKSLHHLCDSLYHRRCGGIFGTVIEFGIVIRIICLNFSSIYLICLLSTITEFILLWLRGFLIVGNFLVMYMHSGLSNDWTCTKGRYLGVVAINILDFSGPPIIIIALFLLQQIIR